MISKIICFFKGHEEDRTWHPWPANEYTTKRRCLYCGKVQAIKPGDIISAWNRPLF